MGFRVYLRALRRRWLVWLVAVAIGLAVAAGAYALTPARYTSTVTFYVATTAASSGAVDTGQFAQNRVASYSQILAGDRVAQLVSRRSGVPIDAVRGRISSSYSQETVLITGVVSAADPARAQQLAAALVEAFPPLVEGLDNQNKNGVGVDVVLVSGPVASAGPVFPVLWQFALAGLLAGLVVGVAMVLIRQALRQTMVGSADVEAGTGLPVLALVPDDRTVGTGRWWPEAASVRAEAYRQLRAQVAAQIDSRVGPAGARPAGLVVAVVSAAESDGRSQIAAGLAEALTGSGSRTLLADADLHHRSLAALCGVAAEPGLTEVLAGSTGESRAPADDARLPVQAVLDSRLELLPAGAAADAADLLAGHPLAALLQRLRQDYDVIVLDTAPLTVSDALVVAARADFALFVVTEDGSSRATVMSALRNLRTGGARVLGLVLNRHRLSRAERARHRQAVVSVPDRS